MKKSIFKVLKETISSIFQNNSEKTKILNHKFTEDNSSIQFSASVEKNIAIIKSSLENSDDIIFRSFEIHTIPSTKATVVFIESLIDENLLESSVLTPLTQGIGEQSLEYRSSLYSDKESLIKKVLPNINTSLIKNDKSGVQELLNGKGILFIDQSPIAVSINITKGTDKTYTEPKTEKVIKGPQQGFVEDLSSNITMIRKRIKSPNLVIKGLQIGRESNTELKVVYLNNIADVAIVDELLKRLDRIDVDGILGSSNIEEYIQDSPANLFKTTFYTERPDRLQTMLLEGRIAIVCDGSPFTVIIPAVISDFFISADDYYSNPYFATFNRLLGYLGALVLIFLPSLYIAITTFHQEMIPTTLALTIAGNRSGVPFPAFVEALIMESAFEALREAGSRLPTNIGQAVSIVGALIIGQAAVEAGLVSPGVVIVVATTAIFSFTMPYTNFSLSLRLVRFMNMILAATLGIYGILTGTLLILLTLISLRSFGVPFMVPFAPLSFADIKNWVLQLPQWSITKRSSHIVKKNINKTDENLKPGPPK